MTKRKRVPMVVKVHDSDLKQLSPGSKGSIKDQQTLDYWIALARLH